MKNNLKAYFSERAKGHKDWLEDVGKMDESIRPTHGELRHTEHLINILFETNARKKNTEVDSTFPKSYYILAAVSVIVLMCVLIATVISLPEFGAEQSQMAEVADRYVQSGIKETGAVNAVAGMILDYRAFDTLGESFVLFTALNCVWILLRTNRSEKEGYFPLTKDNVIVQAAKVSVPVIMLYGIYVILNGHLSAGGGFSGGAILGAGMILFSEAFGDEIAGKVITEKRFKAVCSFALLFYCVSKAYSFFVGANHLESIISTGTPGKIISAGLILPLDIAVGTVVCLNMYGIYCMFKKGRV